MGTTNTTTGKGETMRSQKEVLDMLAGLVTHNKNHGWHPVCGRDESQDRPFITDEEKAAHKQAWTEAGFAVLLTHGRSKYQVVASAGLLDKIGNYKELPVDLWTTGEEGRESQV